MRNHKTRMLAMALTLALCLGLATPALAYQTPDFSDVPSTHWAYQAIMEMADAGVIKGTGGGRFSPNDKLTAEMFLVLVGRVVFPEIQPQGDDWSGPYVAEMKERGVLTTATTDETLKGEITRYEVADIFYRLQSYHWSWPEGNSWYSRSDYIKEFGVTDERELGDMVFSKEFEEGALADWGDIPEDNVYDVRYVYLAGLMRGDEKGNFNGASTLTRMEAATILQRFLPLQERGRLARQVRKERIQGELAALVGNDPAKLSPEELGERLMPMNEHSFSWMGKYHGKSSSESTEEEWREVLDHLGLSPEVFQAAHAATEDRRKVLANARKCMEGLTGETLSTFTFEELYHMPYGYDKSGKLDRSKEWLDRLTDQDLLQVMGERGITAKMLEDAYWAAEEAVDAAWETKLTKEIEQSTANAARIADVAAHMARAEGKETFTFRTRVSVARSEFMSPIDFDSKKLRVGLYGEDGRLIQEQALIGWGYCVMDVEISTDRLDEIFTIKLMDTFTVPGTNGMPKTYTIHPENVKPVTGSMRHLIWWDEMHSILDLE